MAATHLPLVAAILTQLLMTTVSEASQPRRGSERTPPPPQEKIAEPTLPTSPTEHAQTEYNSIVASRNSLLDKSHTNGRGFILLRDGIDSLLQLYRDAGAFSYSKEITTEQRRSLMLIQLEAVSFALTLEQYYMANMGKSGDRGVASEAYRIATVATTAYPNPWPSYIPPRANGVVSDKLIQNVAHITHTRNPFSNDPAFKARSAYIMTQLGHDSSISQLFSAIEESPNDIDVRAIAALASTPDSETETTLLDELPDRVRRHHQIVRFVTKKTNRTTEFWTGISDGIKDIWQKKMEHEASLRAKGICVICEGAGEVRETTRTVNGYSVVLGTSSKIIDCPSCEGTGKHTP